MAGIPLREIPYTGAGPGLTAVLAGQVALVFGNALTVQPTSRAEGCAYELWGLPEWHLLKLCRMPIFSDFRSGDLARLSQQRIGLRSSLHGSGLNATGPIAYPLLRDQFK